MGSQKRFARRAPCAQRRGEGAQAIAQPELELDALLHAPELPLDELERRRLGARELLADLVEREPERDEPADAVEPLDRGLVVEAVPRAGPLCGREEPDLFVVVEGPHGDPRAPRDVADLPAHAGDLGPHAV